MLITYNKVVVGVERKPRPGLKRVMRKWKRNAANLIIKATKMTGSMKIAMIVTDTITGVMLQML